MTAEGTIYWTYFPDSPLLHPTMWQGPDVIVKVNNTSLLDMPSMRRVTGLIVAGILAIVSLIATAATAAVALSQTVQTAHYVNDLSRNVTLALGTQKNIDRKLEQKLDALCKTVEYLGDEIQGLKIRSQLECHVKYHWICVTSRRYNETSHDWDRVKYHLKGIWHNANVSLDLINLHKEIQGLKNAKPLQFDADKLATKFLDHLKGLVP